MYMYMYMYILTIIVNNYVCTYDGLSAMSIKYLHISEYVHV